MRRIGPSNRARDQKEAWMIVPFPQRLATQPNLSQPFPGQAEKNVQERFQDGLQEKAKYINKNRSVHLYPVDRMMIVLTDNCRTKEHNLHTRTST